MKPLSPSDEARLMAAVAAAGQLTAGGLEPTAAVTKVAQDRKLLPGEIQLVCAAHNTGRQAAQMRANTSALDKFASFPLADADAVMAAIYPKVEPPALKEVQAPAVTVKAAAAACSCGCGGMAGCRKKSAKPRDRFSELSRAKRAMEEAHLHFQQAQDLLNRLTGGLVAHFKAADDAAFPRFEQALVTYHGGAGEQLAAYLAHRLPRVKRAAAVRPDYGPVDRARGPLADAALCLRAADVARQTHDVLKTADAHLLACERACGLQPAEKAAGLGQVFMGSVIGALGKSVTDNTTAAFGKKDPIERLVTKDRDALEDTSHDDDLRRIKAQAMLSSLMSDPSDPVSGYPPARVAQTYNELAQLTPHASTQPAVMRPLLRRALEGRFEPFEVKEVTDIERGVRQNKGVDRPRSQVSKADKPSPSQGSAGKKEATR